MTPLPVRVLKPVPQAEKLAPIPGPPRERWKVVREAPSDPT
jgi:hypothetical protein